MSVYGNYTDEYYLIYESDNEVKELMKQWKTSNQIHKRKLFKDNSLSEEEYDTLIEAYKIMRHTDDYKEYKKAFDVICKFCHIVPKGTIITKCEIHSGAKENTNSILVEYTEKTFKYYVYNDYSNLNNQLIDRYNFPMKIFYEEIPYIPNIISEIPIDRLNLIVDKTGILIEESKKGKKYLFKIDDIITFIESSKKTILKELDSIYEKN